MTVKMKQKHSECNGVIIRPLFKVKYSPSVGIIGCSWHKDDFLENNNYT